MEPRYRPAANALAQVCTTCGCLVIDGEAHNLWHQGLADAAAGFAKLAELAVTA